MVLQRLRRTQGFHRHAAASTLVLINAAAFAAVPGKATNPNPAHGASSVPTTASLQWTAGSGALYHEVFFGTSASAVQSAGFGSPEYQGRANSPVFAPRLVTNQNYFWRIDAVGSSGTATGDIWGFSTGAMLPAAYDFWPPNATRHIPLNPVLTWSAPPGTISHHVYLGTSYATVYSATPASSVFKGNQTATSYAPPTLIQNVYYYWRIDEVGPAGVTPGPDRKSVV